VRSGTHPAESRVRDLQAGDTLVEILAAVAIISLALVVFVAALSTASFGVRAADQLTTATNLAASQLETVKGASYDATGAYPLIVVPPGYTAILSSNVITTGLQQVTVTVSFQGQTLALVSNYKVER
jgi:type II secretory pathway pseudopilin PulG